MTAEHFAVCAELKSPNPNEETQEGRAWWLTRRQTAEQPTVVGLEGRYSGNEIDFH